ncbi:MAG: hypothetical protein R3C28_20675 [Pirellulaceae bacterium]
MLGVLTPAQRTKWEEMVGSKFEFSQPQFGRGRGPGGPQQGGRGQRGQRGQRGGGNNGGAQLD